MTFVDFDMDALGKPLTVYPIEIEPLETKEVLTHVFLYGIFYVGFCVAIGVPIAIKF